MAAPSEEVTAQWGFDGSYNANGRQIVVDKMSRWDTEWRAYRGGQNTPLIVINLRNQNETLLPHEEKTTDIQPVWVGNTIYFLSDRDWTMNVWAYNFNSGDLRQVTKFEGTDVKWLGAGGGNMIIEQNGYLHTVDPANGSTQQLNITVTGDFPWSETKWETVSNRSRAASLSPTGKRALMEARGDIYTVPIENGDPRNLTQSSGAADRNPIWSPNGDKIAWFSDKGGNGYALYMADQDGLSDATSIAIGESKMAWEPTWSPDGEHIAFVDDDTRVRVIELATGSIQTIGQGGTNLDRGRMGLSWAPDSKKLAYCMTGTNNFRKIMVWSKDDGSLSQLTNPFVDAFAPSWDRDKKHLYFLASTDVALGSGWANTSSITANPSYAAYVIVLQEDVDSPFIPKSDEEKAKKKKEAPKDEDKGKEKKGKDKEDKAAPLNLDLTQYKSLKVEFSAKKKNATQ